MAKLITPAEADRAWRREHARPVPVCEDLLEPPGELDEEPEARAFWIATVTPLVASGGLNAEDGPLAVLAARAAQQAHDARAEVRRSGAAVKGSRGSVVASPAARALTSANGQVERCISKLQTRARRRLRDVRADAEASSNPPMAWELEKTLGPSLLKRSGESRPRPPVFSREPYTDRGPRR